jgi:hypothetical protein
MSNTAKNLMIVLGILTAAFAGYYFFIQDSSLVVRSSESDRQLEQMLVRTQEFVGHRVILDSITLDTSLFQSDEFRNLQSFSPEPSAFQVGRSNPFVTAEPEQPFSQTEVTNSTQTDLE